MSTVQMCTCPGRFHELPSELHVAPCPRRTAYLDDLVSTREAAREELLGSLVALSTRADWRGFPEAERFVEALGWRHPTEMPAADWVRERLSERLA